MNITLSPETQKLLEEQMKVGHFPTPDDAVRTALGFGYRPGDRLARTLPHRYKVHEHRKDPSLAVRSMPVPPFIVYYRVDDVRLSVRVLSVRHGARRQPRRFKA
jgi:plasmid stabilization system protein ParE